MRKKFVLILLAPLVFGFFAFPISKKANGVAEIKVGSSAAECVMEAESGRILYAENEKRRLPMASTTKILTAITVIERCRDLSEETVIPEEAVGIEGSSVYLKSGEIYTVEDLLYGLMLRSGNDCAVALALKFGKTLGGFAAMMNYTAQKAGAIESNFVTPHGLPSANHYTSAKDLALITRYAMQNEIFAKIVSTQYYDKCGWKNKNKMLTEFDGAIGVKTGYTKEAGRCLVSAAKRDGTTIVCVVLKCGDTYGRSADLLNDAFKSYEKVKILDANTPVEIEWGSKRIVGIVGKDLYYPVLAEERSLIKKEMISFYSEKKRAKKGGGTTKWSAYAGAPHSKQMSGSIFVATIFLFAIVY
ncbi:MAG: D-alanyl-D-alanine carboxypeptidase, partial [Clostridia bacterium]|nr:D-alanyl-D-alanine carboxypeptidase [Clostridia bacterium]